LRRSAGVLYPILFAISLVIGTAAHGAGQYRAGDLALVSATAAIATALLLAVVIAAVALVDRTQGAAPLGAALAMVLVAWFFFYVPAQRTAQNISWRLSRDQVLLPLGILGTVALVAWLLRQSRERLAIVSRFMTNLGAVLLVFVIGQLLFSQRGDPDVAKRSVLVQQLATPLRTSAALLAGRNQPKRDIYLIVLDGHPNSRVSREVLQFNDSSFTDSLRALGFVIPREMHSNYAQTILSMPSLLNASQVTQLAEDAGVDNPSYALPRFLIENNRSARFLKREGYKYVLFPSAWWSQSQHSPLADREFDARPERSAANELRRTELRQAVVSSTLLRYGPAAKVDTMYELRSLLGLREMPADSAPTFVLAHVLLPHMPYYLDASCHVLARPILPEAEKDTPEQRAAHIAQMRCVDNTVLDVVTSLLHDSRPAPVILVVGDHGTRFTAPRFFDRPDSLTPAFMRERFGAFGAFYVPAGGDSAFTGSVSLVNVMGNVLRYYFGAEVPPSSDAMYVSGTYPFRYYRVDSTGYVRESSQSATRDSSGTRRVGRSAPLDRSATERNVQRNEILHVRSAQP
jgi:hypothetical protein